MPSTKFLNVDLDIHAKSGLKELLEAFGSSVIDLREEKDYASLEIASQTETLEETILTFCDLVHDLPAKIRAIWDQCESRSMNIGIQAGTTPYSKEFSISNKTVSLLSDIKVEIVITIYGEKINP